ncbi:MAG: right-handed parallel beta-helix repeat-containing protein [Bacteroidota bacterium]
MNHQLKETIGKISVLFMLGLTLYFLLSCEATTPMPTPPNRPIDINLSSLSSRYIDLSKHSSDTITISGIYSGDRLVFSKAEKKVIHFQNATISSTHAEDAMAFNGPVLDVEILAQGLRLSGGGITFWNILSNVEIIGGRIDSTHTGIRFTQDLPHKNVTIRNWMITNASHEGIYMGPSKSSSNKGSGFFVMDNTITNTGWDPVQVGNVTYFVISGNSITNGALAKEYGQDYGITVNPGSLGYIYNNEIANIPKPIQILDSRAFFHAPDAR